MEKSKVCLLVTPLFNLHATTVAVHQKTTIRYRIASIKDNCRDLCQTLRSQALPRSPLLFCLRLPMVSHSQSTKYHRSIDPLRKGTVGQACNPLLDPHPSNKTLWLRYKEVEIWNDEPLGGIQLIRYRNILALPLMAYPCCPQLRTLPYLIEAEMSESQ